MKLLNQYQDGNVAIELFDDGTKIREYNDEPKPLFPESVDLKITNWCDRGCAFCHESSTTLGKHAELSIIKAMTSGLPAGVELAVGGGDPLSHPSIIDILKDFRDRGLVANATVHGDYSRDDATLIRRLRNENLISGLGVSYTRTLYHESCDFESRSILDQNTVVHFITGIHPPNEVLKMVEIHPKILILGYKYFGRGVQCFGTRVEHILRSWRYWINTIIDRCAKKGGVVSFDNLALEQLRIRERVPSDVWDRCYMGDDGTFTMYMDAVKDEFAVSSTSPRTTRDGKTVEEMFAIVGNGNK